MYYAVLLVSAKLYDVTPRHNNPIVVNKCFQCNDLKSLLEWNDILFYRQNECDQSVHYILCMMTMRIQNVTNG